MSYQPLFCTASNCGLTLHFKRNGSRYCSDACRQRDYRERQKEAPLRDYQSDNKQNPNESLPF